jgi:hypothetical protein
MLLGEGVIAFRQQSTVKGCANLGNPSDMEVVKDAGLNARPIVHGHARILRGEISNAL